jgi:PAS domain S-box-containing protein
MEKQRIYDIVIQNLPVGFSVVDKEGVIVDFNPAAEEITGYSRDEILGKPHFEVLHGIPEKDACPLLKHSLSLQEQAIAVAATIKKKTGELADISVTTAPLIDVNGELAGAVELFRDISETKRRERERKNILSMFAHDMKNPVVTAGGYLSRLLSGKAGELTAKQKSYLETVRDELYRVSDLLADFLEFSRIEAKALTPFLRPCDIHRNINSAVEAARMAGEKKGVTVTVEITEKKLPTILADPAMMDRVVANLLDNAIKYTGSGGTITIGVSEADNDILISVTDTGRGIPKEQLPYIFDAFYRISQDAKGFGLGLFIVKSIVEAHGGRIWAESTFGKGSAFHILLPKN